MAGCPSFSILLARLSHHRRLDVGALSRAAGLSEPALQAVFGGVAPSPSLLRRLAPALDLHAADLFVIAGVAVLDELAPLDAKAKEWIPQLVGHAKCLPTEHRRRLRQFVGTLPQQDRTQPIPPLPVYEQYQPNLGALLVGMLGNRNLNWTATAKTLLQLTGLYLAASTIGAVGHGRRELTPDLLAGFATVLGFGADDLAAMTGIELPDGTPAHNPAAADVAELIWDIRRLTADQVRQVHDQAKSMLQE